MGFNILDAAVLVILLVTAVNGYRKGFFKTLLSLSGVLAAFVAALYFRQGVAEWLTTKMEFFGTLETRIYEKLSDHFAVQVSQTIPTASIAKVLTLPELLTARQQATEAVNQVLFMELSKDLANAITQGFAFVLVFLAVLLVLLVLGIFTSALTELPLLKQANKLAGLALGVVLGVVNVSILMMVITFLIPFTGSTWLMNSLNTSTVAIQIFNYNPLLYLLYYFVRSA